MYSIERTAEILKLLEEQGRVDVNQLAAHFEASRETIRRDLREMEAKGLLKRTHGGAVLRAGRSADLPEFPVGVREIQNVREKETICKAAAAFVQNGDSLFVDNSSTCLYLLPYIPDDLQITLITNSIKLLLRSAELKRRNVITICLGGFFHGSNLSTYGDLSRKNAADFYPTRSFLSCAGIQPSGQLTDSSILEVETKRLMIARSQEVFILADHTKFGRSGPVLLCDLSEIDCLITDPHAEPAQCAPLEQAGVRVVRAPYERGRAQPQ